MAIVATHLASTTDNTGVSTKTTPSVSPGANGLILVSVGSFDAGGNPNTPSTVSGAGLTFDLISSQRKSVVNTNLRISLYRAMSPTPSSGGITVNFGVGTGRIFITVDEFDGVDISGVNGVNAVIQSAFAQVDGVNSGLTATLAALANSSNAAYGYVYQDGNQGISPGSGFTQLVTDNNSGIQTAEYAIPGQTAVAFAWSSVNVGAIAMGLEIKALAAGFLIGSDI